MGRPLRLSVDSTISVRREEEKEARLWRLEYSPLGSVLSILSLSGRRRGAHSIINAFL